MQVAASSLPSPPQSVTSLSILLTTRCKRLRSVSFSAALKPAITSFSAWMSSIFALGHRRRDLRVSEVRLPRRSFGLGSRCTTPSRSMRASISAIVGCSTRAKWARSFCDRDAPSLSACRMGIWFMPKPSGRRRVSWSRWSDLEAMLIQNEAEALGFQPGDLSSCISVTFQKTDP